MAHRKLYSVMNARLTEDEITERQKIILDKISNLYPDDTIISMSRCISGGCLPNSIITIQNMKQMCDADIICFDDGYGVSPIAMVEALFATSCLQNAKIVAIQHDELVIV